MGDFYRSDSPSNEDSVAPDAIRVGRTPDDVAKPCQTTTDREQEQRPSLQNDSADQNEAHPQNTELGGRLDFDRQPPKSMAVFREKIAKKRRASIYVHHTPAGGRRWWKFHLREWDDEDEEDWWMASTAIPLLSATLGPLANVFSIAALVTYWRMCLVDGTTEDDAAACPWDGSSESLGAQLDGVTYRDPRWCYWMNVVSLIVGFVGNFFLLCNFTNRIRYIVALPVTVFMWLTATGILIGITASMAIYVPPISPQQIYTQGYWYAVFAACIYMICSMLLVVNMLGYFLGHYPQHFTLTDSQRTLILQTMLFFIWLAGGAAVFWRLETLYGDGQFNWSYVNSLYFCDVTILTVGFGDLYPTNNVSRGILFPFSVGGIIMLGLVVSSLTKFTAELGAEKVIRNHIENSRARTLGRSVTIETDRNTELLGQGQRPIISSPLNPVDLSLGPRTIVFAEDNPKVDERQTQLPRANDALHRVGSWISHQPIRSHRESTLLVLREEKDRFNAMRQIQANTSRFKNYSALCISILAFGLLWAVGAVIFWRCEKDTQDLTYFKALYFCYVSLLTIGYGDLAPQSNAGRPFFVLWSLIAVPTMAILINNLGDTVIKHFKHYTATVGDFTVLPQKGIWRQFIEHHPWILKWLQRRKAQREARRRLEEGFQVGPESEPPEEPPTFDELLEERGLSDYELAKKLVRSIQRTALDAKHEPKKRYTYEEWVEHMQLIKFTAKNKDEIEDQDDTQGVIEWDWIGEDSPMMAGKSEAEFVLDRLCESMARYIRQVGNSSNASSNTRRISPAQEKDTTAGDSDENDQDSRK